MDILPKITKISDEVQPSKLVKNHISLCCNYIEIFNYNISNFSRFWEISVEGSIHILNNPWEGGFRQTLKNWTSFIDVRVLTMNIHDIKSIDFLSADGFTLVLQEDSSKEGVF